MAPRPAARKVFAGNAAAGGIRGAVFVLNSILLLRVLVGRLGADEFALFALVYPFLRFGFTGAF
ncbi:MAG: hypothetical protein ACREIC_31935, partial [Limisphaerales bacterium]